MIRVSQSGAHFFVEADFDIAEVKSIGARKVGKGWKLPAQRWALLRLIDLFGVKNVQTTAAIRNNFTSRFGFQELDEKFAQLFEQIPIALREKLHGYQIDLVKFLVSTPHRGALVNLDPGLGKTFSSIVASMLLKHNTRYVISPLSFLSGWQDEILDADPNANVYTAHGPASLLAMRMDAADWVLVNYDTFVDNIEFFARPAINIPLLIIDESVNIKNRKSQRVVRLNRFRKHAKQLWLLSGSPITKFADDLWAQLHLIDPQAFSAYWRFTNTYCITEKTVWGDVVRANRTSIDLRDEFRDLIYTVKEQEVLSPVVPKHITMNASLKDQQLEMFQQMKKEFLVELEGNQVLEATSIMSRLSYLQQITSHPINVDPMYDRESAKLTAILNALPRLEKPVLVWTWWRETAKTLYLNLTDAGYVANYIIGDTSNRDAVIDEYKSGELEVLILSLGVGKYGYTLSNTRTVIYHDLTWDADAYIQSLARVSGGLRGIAQEKPHTVITLRSPGTTDDLVIKNLTKKAFSIAHVTQAELAKLLRGLQK